MSDITERPAASFDAMYAAISGRDTRFDGVFYTAVRSTGVYCRPSCPARKPHPRNVTFYPSAAAAQSAGYRACLRCVPEALPGSPWWNIPGSVAARAMELIEQGVVDDEGVTGLAVRLGWSTRTVTRLLVEQTGATPIAHARARRARVAHALITTTDRPFAEIAFAAGFSSIRQFNDTIQAIYGAAPTRLRATRRSEAGGTAPLPGSLRAGLAYRAPFSWERLLESYAAGALPAHERVELGPSGTLADGSYTVAVALPRGAATIALRDGPRRRIVADLALADLRDYGPACALVRRMLDLDADPAAIDDRLGDSEALQPLVRRQPGIRIPRTPTPIEAIVRELAGDDAALLAGEATSAVGDEAASDSPPLRPFPAAEALLATELSPLADRPGRRSALRAALAAAADGRLDRDRPLDEVAAELAGIPGIEPPAIAHILMRGYGSPDADLTGHPLLADAASRLGDGLPAAMAAVAPWRSYAALHLARPAQALELEEPQVEQGGAASAGIRREAIRSRAPARARGATASDRGRPRSR